MDFDWDAWGHTGEFDGLVKYGRLNPYATDSGQVLTDEKLRKDAVRSTRRGMSRWIWRELDRGRSLSTADRILADLDQSRSTYRHGRVHIPLS